jgi:hypothetical protein
MKIIKPTLLVLIVVSNLNVYPILGQVTNLICEIHVLDSKTKEDIPDSKVYGSLGELRKNSSLGFALSCMYSDSLLIEASGYESKMIMFKENVDTVFLEMNDVLLEPIVVSAKKKRVKYHYLGKRSKRYDYFTGYGFDYYQDQKFVSLFPNRTGKNLKIVEGHIFLIKDMFETGDTVPLNLQIQFFEIIEGNLGKELSAVISVEDRDNNKGWFQLNLNDYIILPKNGMYIVIQNLDKVENYVVLGLQEYKEELGIDSYIINKGKRYLYPYDLNGYDYHAGLKMYFKVR